mgnify:CR=1 FL=1
MPKFIHAADIHLDSPLRGLARYDGAPVDEIREASRKALKNLVRLALEEKADFVVIAGDVFDADWKDYSTGLFFIGQMTKLSQAGIRVYWAAGNHDAISPISKSLKLPEGVHVFPTRSFNSIRLDDLGAIIHGRSFPSRAVEEDWVPAFPAPVRGAFNIGILHTSLSGYAGHDTYAPCSLESLANKGYHYWALGHVHKGSVLNETPRIVFPGNIQGRHIRETGAKGCWLVTFEDDEVTEAEFRELDVVRWYNLAVDPKGGNADDMLFRFRDHLGEVLSDAGGRIAAVRVTVTGACTAHEALAKDPEKWRYEIRSAAQIEAGESVWLEKIIFATSSSSSQAPDGLLREILDIIHGSGGSTQILTENDRSLLKRMLEKLPPELKMGDDAFSLDNVDWLRDSLTKGMEHVVASLVDIREER